MIARQYVTWASLVAGLAVLATVVWFALNSVQDDRVAPSTAPAPAPFPAPSPVIVNSIEDELRTEPPTPLSRKPRSGLDSRLAELPSELRDLIANFPQQDELSLPFDPRSAKPPEGGTAHAERLEDGRLKTWNGSSVASGVRDGRWTSWVDGSLVEIQHYQEGARVPPSIHFHQSGAVKAYYPDIDEHGRINGLGWLWHENGAPRAAITWKDHLLLGPAVFFTPDGAVDLEKTRIYQGEPWSSSL